VGTPLEALRTGFVVDLDVPSVIAAEPEFLADCRHCLITSVDSSVTDLAELPGLVRFFRATGHPRTRLGDGVVTTSEALVDLVTGDFFGGFDELWLFPERPTLPRPDGAGLTVSGLPFDRFPEAAEWMAATGCVVGLGDGTGLAYATLDARVAGLVAGLVA
jgi:hypothetical protein